MSASYLRPDDLRLDVDNKACSAIHRPSSRILHERDKSPLSDKTTSTGKHITDTNESDLYAKNPSPPWSVLCASKACRLIDPNDRTTKFFLPDDVHFNMEWIAQYNSHRVAAPSDIFLWVYTPGRSLLHIPEESLVASYNLLYVNADGSETPVKAHVVGSSQGCNSTHYNGCRRCGYIVLRGLQHA